MTYDVSGKITSSTPWYASSLQEGQGTAECFRTDVLPHALEAPQIPGLLARLRLRHLP